MNTNKAPSKQIQFTNESNKILGGLERMSCLSFIFSKIIGLEVLQ